VDPCEPTCELKACPKISPSFLAYISDLPVSVAYNTVALIRRDNARPKSLDVNFTALKCKKTSQPTQKLIRIQHVILICASKMPQITKTKQICS
jgi:hypothetical protein